MCWHPCSWYCHTENYSVMCIYWYTAFKNCWNMYWKLRCMQCLSTDCSAALILSPSTAKLRSLYLICSKEEDRKPLSILHKFNSHLFYSHAVAQAVSHQPLTKEAWVWSRASPLGIYGGQSGMGQAFLWVFLFCTVSMSPPLLHAHSFIYLRCYIILAADSVVKWHSYSTVKWFSPSH
jgi:hypothetical protein